MLRGFIAKTLPGELDGTLNPANYGLGVVPADPKSEAEATLGIAALTRQARASAHEHGYRIEFPRLASRPNMQPFDPNPAHTLAERHAALAYPYRCIFGQAELEIDEGIFAPDLTKVSPFFRETIFFGEQVNFSGLRVLDAFAGSGAFGVNAALMGAHVVGFDKSPQAVQCARKNAAHNNVADQFEVREGTLRETIDPQETFDIILANPPLIPGYPKHPLEVALFDNGLQATRELITALPRLLAEHDRCYLLTSDIIDRLAYKIDLSQLYRDQKLVASIVSHLHLPYESYRVHKIERKTAAIYAKNMLKDVVTFLGTPFQ